MEAPGTVKPFLRRRVDPERAAEVEAGSTELSGRLDRNPVVVALALIAAVMVLQFVVGKTASALVDEPHGDEAASLAGDLAGAVAVIAILGSLGWWRRVGFTGPSHWRKPYLLVPLALLVGLKLLSTDIDLSDGTRAALEIPERFLTGFWEEGLIRTNALWLLVLLHGLYDLPSALRDPGAEATGFKAGGLIPGLLFALYVVFLLRRAKDEDLPGSPQ